MVGKEFLLRVPFTDYTAKIGIFTTLTFFKELLTGEDWEFLGAILGNVGKSFLQNG